jgi:integrative and conjugative element protein (TIGR02256 family)
MSGRIGTLWVAAAVIDDLIRESVEAFPLETGGVLMGYQVGSETAVRTIIGPGPNAKHSKTTYIPDHEYHEIEVARLYLNSGRRTTYLGDWHSHPNGRLYLSGTDAATLKSIAAHSPARIQRPVMAILAGTADAWKIGAWQWMPRRIRALSKAVAIEVRTFP